MRKSFYIHLIITVLSLFSFSAFGQNDTIVEVKRSDNKVIIGGDLYYVHEVKKGHTLYSISKAYNIDQKTIARENPDIFLGLHPGQVLKIPFTKKDNDISEQRDTVRYHYHKVRKGETLYSLARRYQVTTDLLKKYNPVLYEEELKARQVVKIPKKHDRKEFTKQPAPKDTLPDKQLDQAEEKYIYHRVRPKETLYSLSRQYEVKVKDIVAANKQLEENELQFGSVIRIPRSEDTLTTQFMTEKAEKDVLYKDSLYTTKFRPIQQTLGDCDSSDYYKHSEMEVALFLPFYLSENFEKHYIDSSKVNDQGDKVYKKVKRSPYYIYDASENFIEFYEGVLLALNELKKSGIAVNLKVFDTQNDSMQTRKLLYENDFSQTDLIIGPVFEENSRIVSDFAHRKDIDVVSPFSKTSQGIRQNSNLIQIYPSWEVQLERFASYISRFNAKNMVLVHSGDSLYYPPVEDFKRDIYTYISRDTILGDVRFKEVAFRDSMFYLEQAMNKGEENIIIIPSRKEAFVTDVITNLNTLSKKGYDIRVFGYSQWQDFVNLDQEYFYNLRVNVFTPFHVNYERPIVKRIVKQYRNVFKSEPTRYVFHGFDIAYYFLNALYTYGPGYKNCMTRYRPELCHSHYQFYRRGRNYGLENISIFVLKYNPDYTIDEMKVTYETPAPSVPWRRQTRLEDF